MTPACVVIVSWLFCPVYPATEADTAVPAVQPWTYDYATLCFDVKGHFWRPRRDGLCYAEDNRQVPGKDYPIGKPKRTQKEPGK